MVPRQHALTRHICAALPPSGAPSAAHSRPLALPRRWRAQLVYPHANETDLEVMHAWIAEAHAPPPPPPKRALTPKELGEIHAIFSKYDDDKSGGLSAKELKAALKGKFEGVEDAEVDEVFKAYDQDESATLDRAEFQALIVSWIDYHG